MDFFKIVQKMNAKNYTECVAALQGAKMFFKADAMLCGNKIAAFAPKKKDPEAIVKTSKNFRAAAIKAYPDLGTEQKVFISRVLLDFADNGFSMPVLGKLEECSEEEKGKIKEIIGEQC